MRRVPLSGSTGDLLPTMTFIGNATMLLHVGGVKILTDPSFLHAGDHVHVGYGLSAKRLLDPAMEPAALPALDAILLSHLHGDHWDPPAERALDHALPLITTAQAAHALAKRGFTHTIPLAVWESVALDKRGGGVKVTAVPAQHGPKPIAALLPQTNGHVLEFRAPGREMRVYISGDTILHRDLLELPKRFAGIDFAFVHLGGTRIPSARVGVMVTLDAKGGVETVRALDPRTVVPIHTDDWNLFSSGLDDFIRAMETAGLGDRLQVVERGQTIDLATRRVERGEIADVTPAPRSPS